MRWTLVLVACACLGLFLATGRAEAQQPPGAPTIGSVTAGTNTLTISWSAPADTGGTPITSYDLRYIPSNATAKEDPDNWTVRTGIATTDAGTYSLTGLLRNGAYDLQVRAVNDAGPGPWSDSFTQGVEEEAPLVPEAPTLSPRVRALAAIWTPNPIDGGSDRYNYDLRYMGSNPTDEDDDDNWTVVTRAWRPSRPIHYTISGLTDGVSYDVQMRAINLVGTTAWSAASVGTPGPQNTDAAFPGDIDTARTVVENTLPGQNIGEPFTATDIDGDRLTYFLEDPGSPFDIEPTTGQLLTKAPLNYEHTSTYLVVVLVRDDKDANGDYYPVSDDRLGANITIEDVNEAPVVTGPRFVAKVENSTTFVAAYQARDQDGDAHTWSHRGADFDYFEIDPSGNLRFSSPPDFEERSDRFYRITVVASDGTLEGTRDVIVRIDGINEPPVIDGPAEVSFEESRTGLVAGYTTTDPEKRRTVWGLEGNDANDFEFDDGRLSFEMPPDFEAPTDVTGDNAYHVFVISTDGENRAAFPVTVMVTNKDEPGKLTLFSRQPIIGFGLPATLTDPDIVEPGTVWTWARSRSGSSNWTAIDEATELDYAPVAADRDHYLRATASYTDGHGPNKHLEAVSEFQTKPDPGANTEPFFPVVPAGDRDLVVPEDTPPGTHVGDPVQASDSDDHPLTYTLTGADGFAIDGKTGQIRVAPDGMLDFTMAAVYSATVTATDPLYASALVQFEITITDVNEAPVARDDAATTREDEAVVVPVVENDRDPENDDLEVMSVTAPQSGVAEVDAGGKTITYTPRQDHHGADSFAYTVSDGDLDDQAQVTVTVRPLNDAPAFAAATAERSVSANAQPGANVGVPVIATDVDDDALTYSLSGASDFVIDDTGQIQVAPGVTLDRERTPSYDATVTATDRSNASDSITVTINVFNVNEAPTAVNDTATTTEDQSVRIDVLDNDTDPDTEPAALTVSVLRQPLNGTARVESDRTITYTPNANYHGPPSDTFTYTVSDGSLTDDGSVTVTVEAVNDAPTFPSPTAARSVSESAQPGANVDVPVTANDVDGDLLGYRLQGAPEFEIDEDTGQIQVAPGVTLDRERTPSYEVTVTASDGKGGTDSITVTINVSNVNEAPTAVNDTAMTREDQSVRIDVLANDADPDTEPAALTVSVLRQPLNGTARVESDRTITYTPNANYHGPPSDTFTYTVSDGSLTDDGSVTVTVEAVNDAPTFPSPTAARSVSESAQPGANVDVPVTANDVDGDLLGYRLQGAPEFEIDEDTGQIQVAPGVTLDRERTPSYEVTVTASDGKGGTDSITVTINVSNVNEAPTAVNDTAMTREDQSVRIDVLANDTDPDTEPAALTVSVLRQPLNGTARVESDRTITYTPNANFAGENTFTYTVSDGSLTDDGSVTVTVEAVNDAPTFPSPTAARSVPEDAEADDNVGAPVTAMDVESALPTYSLSGADSGSFNIDADSGQITVATGVTFDIATQETYVVTVTADDGSGEANATATVEVTITVGAGPPIIIITGGGGGGPTPSEADFEWNVKRDLEELDGGNDRATGVWSDGTTLWVADNADGAGDAVYAYDRETGERVEEREFTLAETNRAPRGFWSDRSVVWVSDSGQERLFAYDLATGERLEEREFALAEGNSDARGIWSDEETMWVLDSRAGALFAYDFESGELLGQYALDAANGDPHGIWSDCTTVWVSDHGAKRLFAYRLPAPEGPAAEDAEPQDLERVLDEEFSKLSRASNNSPRGLWSDGDVMYVADESDDRVYTYNMPDAIDARLASLTLSGVDIGEFSSSNTEYEGVVSEGVTETTVEAGAMQPRTDIAIDPPDADMEANGHQVALQDLDEITVTVTLQDGSRKKTYRVQFPETAWDPARDPWPHCLRGAISEGFSLVVYEGGSVEELVSCAESRGIVTLYMLHEGVFVSYILGAPDFVNAGFLELFPDGLPPITPLVAASNGPPSADPFGDLDDGGRQPWPECLRGDIAAGFSLVVHKGGSVEELEACARSADITALYALSEGEFVSYILGAPDFVTQPFRDLFADGLPLMTPLVARSGGQPGGR